MKVYIAGPIFNPHQLRVIGGIKSVLEMHKCEIFSPYDESREIWKGRAPKDCTPEERQRVVNGNIKGLHWADVLVAWVGGHQSLMHSADTGTVWEMGYFKALTETEDFGDPYHFTIAYVDPRDLRQNMNLMLAETVDAAVRGMAQLSIALEMLRQEDGSGVQSRFHPSKLILQEKEPIG